jgi:N-acetylglucosamine-6-phosphate deacetylase
MNGSEEIEKISRNLLSHGVTAWLPTAVASSYERTKFFLDAVSFCRKRVSGARVLGAHLESNFISPFFRGAQPPENIRSFEEGALSLLMGSHEAVKLITLAPELPGILSFVRELKERGVFVACGHSDATFEQVEAGMEAGITRVTHLFNAQHPFQHREPGVAGAGLSLDRLYAEVIADGVHLHPAVLKVAARCKGEKLLLVSDSLMGTDLGPGSYDLGGQKTLVKGGVARLESGAIAGSVLTLERAVSNFARWAEVPLHSSFLAATENPARSLGLSGLGRIAEGNVADLALFSPDLTCQATFVEGELVYRSAGFR